MIVITDMYTSPPVTDSTLLQQTVTKLLVSCIIKPAVPRLIIFLQYPMHPDNSFFFKSRTFNSAFLCKKAITNKAEKICEITVAIAAPQTPICNTKIKTGSSRIFNTAPTVTEHIPATAYPCALINGFIPVAIIEGKVPSR